MIKIGIKKIVEFNRDTDRSKASLIRRTQKPKENKSDGGGNYWVRSLSAIVNACKENDNSYVSGKISEISELMVPDMLNKTKNMHNRNIQILHNFEDFDFEGLKPSVPITYLGGLRSNSTINTQGLLLQLIPSVVFSYKLGDALHVGAVLFLAQLQGYSKQELELVCEALFRYLKVNYSEDHEIDRRYCRVVDVMEVKTVAHADINANKISKKLNETVKAILKLM